MNIVSKTLRLRKGAQEIPETPMEAYNKKISIPFAVYDHVKKIKIKQKRVTLYELRRQCIVALVSGFEIYWRELIKILVDSYNVEKRILKKFNNKKIALSNFEDIDLHKISLGELITNGYTIQSLDSLNEIIEKILRKNVFDEFLDGMAIQKSSDLDQEEKECKRTMRDIGFKKFVKEIELVFEIRHETVHNFGTQYDISEEQLYNMHTSVTSFNMFYGAYVEVQFNDVYKQKKKYKRSGFSFLNGDKGLFF